MKKNVDISGASDIRLLRAYPSIHVNRNLIDNFS